MGSTTCLHTTILYRMELVYFKQLTMGSTTCLHIISGSAVFETECFYDLSRKQFTIFMNYREYLTSSSIAQALEQWGLVRDLSVYPVRGQMIEIEGPQVPVFNVEDNTQVAYIIPRGGRLFLGGTTDQHNWSTACDAVLRSQLGMCNTGCTN